MIDSLKNVESPISRLDAHGVIDVTIAECFRSTEDLATGVKAVKDGPEIVRWRWHLGTTKMSGPTLQPDALTLRLMT
jgi:hypothetical protein